MPPLRVVHYPGIDTKARANGVDVDTLTSQLINAEDRGKAFKPGPFDNHSWSVDRNTVPTVEYKHADEGYFK